MAKDDDDDDDDDDDAASSQQPRHTYVVVVVLGSATLFIGNSLFGKRVGSIPSVLHVSVSNHENIYHGNTERRKRESACRGLDPEDSTEECTETH